MKFSTIRTHMSVSPGLRRESSNGVTYLVAPTVILTEGVHNGSRGRVYHPREELAKFTEAWNGIPIPVLHPEKNGQPISANTPEIIEQQTIGRLFNVEYTEENGPPRIVGEAWLDISKAARLVPGLIEGLEARTLKIDVSTGMWHDDVEVKGTYGDEPYDLRALAYRPDHLALLPGQVGACSWTDGCGLPRVNCDPRKAKPLTGFARIKEVVLSVLGLGISEDFSFGETHQLLQRKVNEFDNESLGVFHYVEDVYDDYFVYFMNQQGQTTFYKRSYAIDNDKVVSLGDDATQVRQKVEWVETAQSDIEPSANNNKEQEVRQMICKDKVEALIANKNSPFTASDTDYLSQLAEEAFDMHVKAYGVPVTAEPTQPKPKPQPVVQASDAQPAVEPEDVDSYLAKAPPAVAKALRGVLDENKKTRDALVDRIVAHEKNKMTKEQLDELSMDALRTLAHFAGVEEPVAPNANYAGQGGSLSSADVAKRGPVIHSQQNGEEGQPKGLALPSMSERIAAMNRN